MKSAGRDTWATHRDKFDNLEIGDTVLVIGQNHRTGNAVFHTWRRVVSDPILDEKGRVLGYVAEDKEGRTDFLAYTDSISYDAHDFTGLEESTSSVLPPDVEDKHLRPYIKSFIQELIHEYELDSETEIREAVISMWFQPPAPEDWDDLLKDYPTATFDEYGNSIKKIADEEISKIFLRVDSLEEGATVNNIRDVDDLKRVLWYYVDVGLRKFVQQYSPEPEDIRRHAMDLVEIGTVLQRDAERIGVSSEEYTSIAVDIINQILPTFVTDVADLEESRKLEELSLLDFSQMQVASDTSAAYAAERRKIMGQATRSTKLIKSEVNTADDSITFFFLTEATEKYGPDHAYKDTNPDRGFSLEPDPSRTYEIQLQFKQVSTLTQQPITIESCKYFLWHTDFAIWSNSPSFHWQGFNYNLSQMGAAIHPTNIAPQRWDKIHGAALIDKHLIDLFIHIKFFLNQMASSLFNKTKHMKVDTQVTQPEPIIEEKIVPSVQTVETPYAVTVDSAYKGKKQIRNPSVAKAVTIPAGVEVDAYVFPQQAGEDLHVKISYDGGRYVTDLYFDNKMDALRHGWAI